MSSHHLGSHPAMPLRPGRLSQAHGCYGLRPQEQAAWPLWSCGAPGPAAWPLAAAGAKGKQCRWCADTSSGNVHKPARAGRSPAAVQSCPHPLTYPVVLSCCHAHIQPSPRGAPPPHEALPHPTRRSQVGCLTPPVLSCTIDCVQTASSDNAHQNACVPDLQTMNVDTLPAPRLRAVLPQDQDQLRGL